jgi:hypothetical protein
VDVGVASRGVFSSETGGDRGACEAVGAREQARARKRPCWMSVVDGEGDGEERDVGLSSSGRMGESSASTMSIAKEGEKLATLAGEKRSPVIGFDGEWSLFVGLGQWQ